MSGSSIADNGLSSFEAYTAETSPEQVHKHLADEPVCLADYIQAWVQSGDGVRQCNGDFQTFLITVIGIIDEWRTDERFLDYVTSEHERSTSALTAIKRRPKTVFGERGMDHVILDPHFFATRTFRWLHDKRNER
jgi:hypothetical protein